MDEPQQLTVSLWIAPDNAAGDVVSIGDSVLIRIDETTGRLQGAVYDGDDWKPVEAVLPGGTGPRHVAFVVDAPAGRQALYLDGQLIASATRRFDVNYTIGYPDVTLGVHAQKDRLFYTGMMDEVTFSAKPRSASWIKLCYENERPEGQSLVTVSPARR